MSKFRLRGKRRRNKAPREGSVPLRAMLPNLITSIAVCGGITCITIVASNYARVLSNQPVTPRDWFKALMALLVACVCDGIDGRVARLLKCSSKLGAELDSLADFVNFGVAPALFIYFWCLCANPGMTPFMRNLFLGSALFYAMCDAFRLARFNTMLEQPTLPYWKHFFLGVPAPGGCWMVLTPAILSLAFQARESAPLVASVMQNVYFGMFMLLFIGLLMASRLPTISLKALHISRAYMLPTMAGLLLLVAFLVTQFWLTLGIVGVCYIATIPFVGMMFVRTRSRYLREQGQTAPEAAKTEN
jgi:CDP-diacylglycerol--serine O-phosphatidyltransferase